MDMVVREEARAKINLALHVTGQRADGYHLLDMLVTFTDEGDRLSFSAAQHDSVELSGRFAAGLDSGGSNLVDRARDSLRAVLEKHGVLAPPVAIHLEKNLPIAAGIGGGSADAAATLRGLLRLWGASLPIADLDRIALRLGADVPMCLRSRPLIARGIGEDIQRFDRFPAFAIVLANPMKGISTPVVFRALHDKRNPGLQIDPDAGWPDRIKAARNDLEAPARAYLPEIAEISDMLRAQGAWLVRMSGSGATCFGLFDTLQAARAAEKRLHADRPDWYFCATTTVREGE